MNVNNQSIKQFKIVLCFQLVTMTLALFFPLSGISSQSTLDEEIENCSTQYGYKPYQSTVFGDHELAGGERDFLNCVYMGINKNIIPNSLAPDAYKKLVDRHRGMTDAVEKGEMTRAQRKTETMKLIDEIKVAVNNAVEQRKEQLEQKKNEIMLQQLREQNTQHYNSVSQSLVGK